MSYFVITTLRTVYASTSGWDEVENGVFFGHGKVFVLFASIVFASEGAFVFLRQEWL